MNRTPSADSLSAYSALAQEYGTPLYSYDMRILREAITRTRSAFTYKPFALLYATMANDQPEILRTVASMGVGACVNSIPHMHVAIASGIAKDSIHFTSSGIPPRDCSVLQEHGVAVNVDSVRQIEAYFRAGKGRSIGLRLNSGWLRNSPPPDCDRIGVDGSGLQDAVLAADRWGGQISGVHVYCGTNLRSTEDALAPLRKCFDIAQDLKDLQYINIGGGVGVDYAHTGNEFDLRHFAHEVGQMAKAISRRFGRAIQLIFEPGRSLVATCGVFLATVTDVKQLNGEYFIAVDASIAGFPRPFHHRESYHRVSTLKPYSASRNFRAVVITGRTTFSQDILAKCDLPDDIDVGDVLLFEDAGAYCESMMSRFLGQPEPKAVFTHNAHIR